MKVVLQLYTFLTGAVLAQEVVNEIGFGQASDSGLEGEDDVIDVRRLPELSNVSVSGQIILLTLSQYMNYTFMTPRAVSEAVQMAIDAITDPAECESECH